MKKKMLMTVVGLTALVSSASAQLKTSVTAPDWQGQTAKENALIEHINQMNPRAIKEKGLTPELADKAAMSARNRKIVRNAAYTGPDANQEFWFVMPDGYKLGYDRGFYRSYGNKGNLELIAKDATGNLSARFNGALVNGKFHTITGDLSWTDYGVVLCHDQVYDPNNNWQLFKSVNLQNVHYVISQEVAVDPRTQRVYGTFLCDDYESYDIAWVDYDAPEIHRIGRAQRAYPGLGMNAEGRLFGIDMDGVLYEISLKDGTDTKIGETGIVVRDEDDRYFMQSAECGQKANVLYWAAVFPDGKSAFYAVDLTTAEATKIADFPDYTLIHCLTIPNTMAEDEAPAAVTNLQAVFDKTATTGKLTFTMPTKTYNGGNLASADYMVRIDGVDNNDLAGNAQAGDDVSIDLTLAEGSHYVEVYASNSAGLSPQANIGIYVGLDKPGQVQNPKLKVNGKTATITWEPATGANGGYAGNITYSVRRNYDLKTVATGLTEPTYTDEIPLTNYRQVSYIIIPSSESGNGIRNSTNSVAVGDAYDLPYQEDFLTSNDYLKNFTVVDANNDGVTWRTNITNLLTTVYYSYNISSQWTNIPANDWLFTPGFNLKAGKTYNFTFSEACNGEATQCINKVEVMAGQGASIEDMTTELMPATEFKNNERNANGIFIFNDVTLTFTPEEDGVYNFGFHIVSDQRKTDFILDKITLEEQTADDSPAAVTDLTVEAGEQGSLNAIISFTAPAKTLGGADLASLTNARIIKGNRVICSFDNPAPGEKLTYTDTKADNGYNTYAVVATNEVSDGPIATAMGYIGIDTPLFDWSSVGAEDNVDHITVKWDEVGNVGLNGGYVDPSQVSYYVYNVDYDVETGMMTAGNYLSMAKASDHLDIARNTDEGEQEVVSYAIVAANSVGADENHTGATYGMVVGQPYPLPFIQSAANSKLGNKLMWAETENTPDAAYKFSTDSYDQDNGSFIWAPTSRKHTLGLNTGKISLAGSNNPKLMFAHKADPGVRFQLEVVVETPDREETSLKSVNYQNIKGSEAAWTLESVDLSDFLYEDYIVVKFKMSSNSSSDNAIKGKTFQIDAINVLDMQPYNLSVDIDAPESIVAGRSSDINVVVHNVGERDASGYEVKLFVDEEEVYAETVSDKLSSLESKTITVNYVPSVFADNTRSTLRAALTWLYDLVDEDNEMETEVAITDPQVKAPLNPTKVANGGSTDLAWEAPVQEPELVKESFEGSEYTDFDLCGITMDVREGKMGDWTIWNLDGDGTWNGPHGPTGHLPGFEETPLDGIDFPNIGQVCAWMVFNNSKVIGSMPIVPHSGNKMAATFDDFVKQDTWLITPELSGNAQTVTFYAAAPVTTNWLTGELDQVETFEVLVSSKGLAKEDFEPLGSASFDDMQWLMLEIEVEAGTKYVAIRNISDDYNAMAMFVDDVTFERMSPMPVSYNVYGDEQLIENVPAGLTLNVDGKATTYAVTAVYANGDESRPVYFLDNTGIVSFNSESPLFNVYTLDGVNVRYNASSVKGLGKGVYIVNGKKLIVK